MRLLKKYHQTAIRSLLIASLATVNAAIAASPSPKVEKFDIKGFSFPMSRAQILNLQEGRKLFSCKADMHNLADVCYVSFSDMRCEKLPGQTKQRCDILWKTAPEQLAKLKTFAGRGASEIQFHIFNDQLIRLTVFLRGGTLAEDEEVKQALVDKYGPPTKLERETTIWEGRGEKLLLSRTAIGLVNIDLSEKMSARLQEAEAKKASEESSSSNKRKSDF